MSRSRAVPLASAALTICCVAGASAQELPRSGDFTVSFAHVNPDPFGAVPVGDGNVAFALTYITASVNAAGAGFMHDLRGRCVGILITNQAAGTSRIDGHCDWQDAEGDHIFEAFSTNGQVNRVEGPMGGVQSVGRFLGGTGKYHGLTGEMTITLFGATTTPDGYTQVLGRKDGHYQLP
jgi:hypothetical protein